jgi:hypothetical protein
MSITQNERLHTSVCAFAFSQSLPAWVKARSVPVRCAIETIGRTPYVDAVSTDENGGSIWVLPHGIRHAIFEVLLIGGIFDNRYLQSVKVGKRGLHAAYTHALDHLDFETVFNICRASGNNAL